MLNIDANVNITRLELHDVDHSSLDVGSTAMILYITNSNNVIVNDLIIDGASGGGLAINSANRVRISNLSYRNNGSRLSISDANDVRVSDSSFRNTREGGIRMGFGTVIVRTAEISNVEFVNIEGDAAINSSYFDLTLIDSRFENCMANTGALKLTLSDNNLVINTKFINCNTNVNFYNGTSLVYANAKIFYGNNTAFRGCEFTDTNSGSSPFNYAAVFGGWGYMTFENCTFNNLRAHSSGSYLFDMWAEYPSVTGGGGVLGNTESSPTFENCTFNFNSGSAGLMAFGAGGNITGGGTWSADSFLMDNCRINNNGGQQPLIWLHNNTVPGTFRFRANNVYNGTTMTTAASIISTMGSYLRLTNGAAPVIAP